MPQAKHGWIYVKHKKTKPNQPGHWSEAKKLEAATTYLATGNYALTSRIINIPEPTMVLWKNSEWWPELIAQIQQSGDVKLSSRLESVVDKSLNAVNEILENGDYHYDQKRGQIVRVPPKLRDVHKITTDLIDKQTILRKQIKPQQQNEETTDGKLQKLADAFSEFAKGIKKTIKEVDHIIEGDFETLPPDIQEAIKENDDAVYDQREARLQEGSGVGQTPQDENGGQGQEEQGPTEGSQETRS